MNEPVLPSSELVCKLRLKFNIGCRHDDDDEWPELILVRCTNSSAGGSDQKWSGVLALLYSRAHGPTNKELKIDPESGSATSESRS